MLADGTQSSVKTVNIESFFFSKDTIKKESHDGQLSPTYDWVQYHNSTDVTSERWQCSKLFFLLWLALLLPTSAISRWNQ